VPLNSFAEYAPEPNPEKNVVWFALNEDRPLCAFAGIWTEFNDDRGTKSKPIAGPHNVYGFLTTELNAVVEQTRSQNEAYNRCRHVVVRHSKFDHVRCHGFKHSKEDSP
jgi:putative SOS response-associated peptidase YedK